MRYLTVCGFKSHFGHHWPRSLQTRGSGPIHFESSRFVIYWRRAFERIHAAESTDGIHWAYHWDVLRSGTATEYLSPSLARRAVNDWWLWVGGGTNFQVHRSTSPLSPWTYHAHGVMPDPGTPGNLWHHLPRHDGPLRRPGMVRCLVLLPGRLGPGERLVDKTHQGAPQAVD